MKKSFFLRLMTAIGFLMIFIFLIIIYVLQLQVKKEAEATVLETSETVAAHTVSQINQAFDNIDKMTAYCAAALANADISGTGARAAAIEDVKSLLKANPDIYNVWFAFEPDAFDGRDAQYVSERHPTGRFIHSYVNANGAITEINNVSEALFKGASRPYWYTQPFFSGEAYYGDSVQTNYGDGRGDVMVGRIVEPIIRDGETIGCVGVSLAYGSLFKFMADMRAPDKRVGLVVSNTGHIVYSPNPEDVGKLLIDYPDIDPGVLKAITSKEAFYTEGRSPFLGMFAYTVVKPARAGKQTWFLYLDTSSEMVRRLFIDRMSGIILIFALGLVFMETIMFFLTRTLTKPIKLLTEAANEIAGGDFDQTLMTVDFADDEIGVLAGTLNHMLYQLQQNAVELENKVEQRTAALQFMKKRAEEAAAVKMQFLANMSHEIRTPMNAITGMTELLMAENLNERQRHFVSDIQISASALLNIVNDILDLSKIEAGKLELAPDNFDFPLFIENIASLMFFAVIPNGIEFICEQPPDVPKCLFGDSGRLRQVLVNILGNAVKFTRQGYVKLKIRVKEASILFVVEDTGIGIKEADMPNLFNVFEQTSNVIGQNIQGTGLGLSISKNLLQMMGGTIDFVSTYGKGTTFIIEIPKVPGDENALSKDESVYEFISASKARVLVVDDNEINLNVATGLLGLSRIKNDTANSGRLALELLKNKPYDLVFLDHMMPDMDGVETVRRLRKSDWANRDVPVIALTANAISGAKEMFLQVGMNDFLSKPIDKVQLGQVLQKWLPESVVDDDAELAQISAESQMVELTPRLAAAAAAPGLDVTYGLRRMEGMAEVYERSLRVTARKIPPTVESITAAFAATDISAYTIHIHGMKSALAEIGAMDLSGEARALEAAANKNDLAYCRANTAHFVDGLVKLGAALSAVFDNIPEETAVAKAAGSVAELKQALSEVYEALDDFAGAEALEALRGLKRNTYGEALDKIVSDIYNAAEEFDYEAGMIMIQAIDWQTQKTMAS